MVRKRSVLISILNIKNPVLALTRLLRGKKEAVFFLFAAVILFAAPVYAAPENANAPAASSDKEGNTEAANKAVQSDSAAAEPKEGKEVKTLSLKLMVVNPSKKFKQTYSLKSYLPEEIKPDHVVDKGGLSIGYDADKKAYYLAEELELEPGQSVLKAIKVEDVWIIAEEELKRLSDEAHDLFSKLGGTEYEDQGRLLLNNIEVSLVQISERQSDPNVGAEQHISIYRENKKKVYDIEMDLMALRRFVAASGGQGVFGKNKSGKKLPAVLERLASRSSSGSVPAWVLWKVIFSILIFIGAVSFLFVGVLHQQILSSAKKLYEKLRSVTLEEKQKKKKEEESLRIGDFFSGLPETETQAGSKPSEETSDPSDLSNGSGRRAASDASGLSPLKPWERLASSDE